MIIKDQINRKLNFDSKPKRIVCLVPSLTELLIDLELEDQLVGITKFCVHPYYLKQTRTIVGGTKQVKFDKIDELNPDFILCNKEENTEEIVTELSKKYTVYVSDIFTIDDVLNLIKTLGLIFSKNQTANNLIDKIKYQVNDFKSFISEKQTLKVAYFIWRNPYLVAANNTFINYLLELNKFDNIYKNKERYPEIDIAKMRQEGDPEIVFLSSEPYPFKEEHAFEIGRHSHHAKVIFVDGEYFSWYGSRLIKAFDYFKSLRNEIE